MLTSEWPTIAQAGHGVPFVVRQGIFLRRAGIEVDVFPFRGAKSPLNYFRAWKQLQAKLRRERYDLIHAQWGQSGLLALPKRLPLVVTLRGDDILGVRRPDGRQTPAGKLLQEITKLVARRADAVVAVADHMRDQLPASVQPYIIPSGLDFEALPCMPQAEARQRLGLPRDERLALWVGNPANERKRCDLAKEAVELLNKRLPTRLLVVWGVPSSEIPIYMNACDVFVFTSSSEGSPNVVKEALACNLPVVSVDIGDVRMRLQNVPGGEVCADDRPETIAGALERVLRKGGRVDSRETLRSLDEKVLTEKLIGVYRSVLTKSSAVNTEESVRQFASQGQKQ